MVSNTLGAGRAKGRFVADQCYVWSNVISVMGWVGVKFPEKMALHNT